MSRRVQLLSRRYAQAYINVFGDQLSLEDVVAFKRVHNFFETHRGVRALLKFPETQKEAKREFFVELCKKFGLADSSYKLMAMLIEHKRSFLIAPVLRFLCLLYEQRYGVISFAVTSSHLLDEAALQCVEQFLAVKTGKRITYTHAIDKDLIAGMRLQSGTLLWEYSVRKQLKCITNYLSAEG